jgi:hypothetical protein
LPNVSGAGLAYAAVGKANDLGPVLQHAGGACAGGSSGRLVENRSEIDT